MSDSVCSMTPPLSPLQLAEQQDVELLEEIDLPPILQKLGDVMDPQMTKTSVCFHCQGEVFPKRGSQLYQHVRFHEKGILKSGILERLFHSDFTEEIYLTVDLFGYPFPYSALSDRMEKVFRFARQTVSAIQNSSDRDGLSTLNDRQDLVGFLDFVRTFVHRCMPDDENERRKFLRSLLRQFHLLLVHCGRISEDVFVAKYSLAQVTTRHHNFHCRLELTWNLLTVFHTLTTVSELPLDIRLCQSTSVEEEQKLVFDQLVAIVMFDLTTLAVPIFEKMTTHEWLHISPFPCACVMEMWVLLIHLLRQRKEKFDTESFWVQLYQVLQSLERTPCDNSELEELDSDVFILSISPPPSKPLEFCLWLFTHLAQLLIFNHHGNLISQDQTQNCFFIVQSTLEKMLKSQVKEETLRACLRCCLACLSLWHPPNQLLASLWEHFSQKLNSSFQIHTSSVVGLAVISKSASSLLERCKKWCNSGDTGLEQETSFHLFLRLLAQLLGHSGALTEWKQIKGRFFSKFHKRRMQDLNEAGLHNMTCLFLTVAIQVDAEDVARKLLALYDMVNSSLDGRLRAQVWCGALAFTLLLVKQRLNCSFLAERLASSFNSMARQLSNFSMDCSQNQELSPLITLYFDGVRDIVEQSQLEGAEYLLIDKGIDLVLRRCSDSQMRHALTALDSIIMRLRCLINGQNQVRMSAKENHIQHHIAFADRLWLNVFPFVHDHVVTSAPPLSLADLAISFTYLAVDFPAPISACHGGITGVVRVFISETTHTSITCHYLNQILGDQWLRNKTITLSETTLSTSASLSTSSVATAAISSSCKPLLQTDVVKCWWKCVMLMTSSSSSLAELTQHVTSLPDIECLLLGIEEKADLDLPGSVVGWKQILKAIGFHFDSAQSLLEKQKIRDQVMPYFADIGQQTAPVIRTSAHLDIMLNVYRVVGYLVKQCAPVLYLQSKPCPLPEIIRSLILPASVLSTDRPLTSTFLTAVKDTLHLFLEGLSHLDYRRDSYIQRQVRSIITHYVPRFPLSLLDVYSHPVLRLLGRLPHQTVPSDADFHRFVVDAVVEVLQKSPSTISTEMITILRTRFAQ